MSHGESNTDDNQLPLVSVRTMEIAVALVLILAAVALSFMSERRRRTAASRPPAG